RHLLFRWPGIDIRNSASRVAPGVDVRGEGGYIVCAPSMHPSGKRYAWSVDSATCFACAPEWLLSMITRPAPIMMPITMDSDAADSAARRLKKGSPNATLPRFVGHFFPRHVDPELVLAAALAIGKDCKPPLPSAEVTRIVNSIAGRELKGRMQ